MHKLSTNMERFQSELSHLVAESSKVETRNELKDILIRLTALQRIIYDELDQQQSTCNDS